MSTMTPRYNLFWHEPNAEWCATTDTLPNRAWYGESPEEALQTLLDAVDAIRNDDEKDGHVDGWCAVCWTTAEECNENATQEQEQEAAAAAGDAADDPETAIDEPETAAV